MAPEKSDGYAAVERPPIVIVIDSIGRGRFRARLGGHVFVAASTQPLLDSARLLIAKGCDPVAVLEMRRAGSTAFDLRGPLRVVARLDVKDARFVKHRPRPDGHGKADASLMDAADAPGPNPALRPRSTGSGLAASVRPAGADVVAAELDRVAGTPRAAALRRSTMSRSTPPARSSASSTPCAPPCGRLGEDRDE
jgi:hypothetical protein